MYWKFDNFFVLKSNYYDYKYVEAIGFFVILFTKITKINKFIPLFDNWCFFLFRFFLLVGTQI